MNCLLTVGILQVFAAFTILLINIGLIDITLSLLITIIHPILPVAGFFAVGHFTVK